LHERLQGSHRGTGRSRFETVAPPQEGHDRIVEQIIERGFAPDPEAPSAITQQVLAGRADPGGSMFQLS
jgi:hypothetical protein